jgi:pilus assembly protein Flp/PilA
MRLIRVLQRFSGDCRGATAVEYGLIVAMIVLVIVGSVRSLANENTGMWAFVVDVTGVMGG